MLVDPHQEEQLMVFPRRTILWDRLPEYDLLVISHHHLDHFDVATLSRLSREVPVMIPDTPVLSRVLDALGYGTIRTVLTNRWIEIGGTRLLATPSAAPFHEFGLLIQDVDGVFWNQVDSVLTTKHVDLVMAQAGSVDLLLATWQPMLEAAVQQNQPVQFPALEYGCLLANVSRVHPKALAPGANGFEYTGKASWLNRVVFPQSRERFLFDVTRALPALTTKAFPFDPGDVLELKKGETSFYRRRSSFVSSEERDPFVLEFSPATAQRPLSAAADAVTEEDRTLVVQFLETRFVQFIAEHPVLFRGHCDWNVIFQLELAFPEESQYWWIDFAEPHAQLHSGRSALANLFCGLTASGLAGLLAGRSGWDRLVVGGGFYQHERIYGICQTGVVLPQGVSVMNPLMLLLPEDETFERMIDHQIGRALSSSPQSKACIGAH
jgi:hypothetical protein